MSNNLVRLEELLREYVKKVEEQKNPSLLDDELIATLDKVKHAEAGVGYTAQRLLVAKDEIDKAERHLCDVYSIYRSRANDMLAVLGG